MKGLDCEIWQDSPLEPQRKRKSGIGRRRCFPSVGQLPSLSITRIPHFSQTVTPFRVHNLNYLLGRRNIIAPVLAKGEVERVYK